MSVKWNLDSMNFWCKENAIEYTVLETKWVNKHYQNQLWAFVKCNNENHNPYWTWWNNFRRGYWCKQCDYENNNKINWDVDKIIEFYNKHNLTIVNMTEYENVDKSITCLDKNGFKVFASITNLKAGRTPSFLQRNKYAIDNLKLYCQKYRPDYELVSDRYTDGKSKYLWKYIGNMLPSTECNIFELSVDSFVNAGTGHPYFSKSKGEIMFEELLILNNINYIKEKTFKGCKDKSLLRFDFYLPDYNENIEIDGIQHSTLVKGWNGKKGLEDRIKKDKIKNDYCKNNNIKLTRLHYDHRDKEAFGVLINNKINEIINYKNNLPQKIHTIVI